MASKRKHSEDAEEEDSVKSRKGMTEATSKFPRAEKRPRSLLEHVNKQNTESITGE